ncbi:hypothetical protein HDU96_007866 [Phlyctochytrium bullatum]|nr:hypothetical protein HDU96_007866 [Phlyctochytrium bullatum]
MHFSKKLAVTIALTAFASVSAAQDPESSGTDVAAVVESTDGSEPVATTDAPGAIASEVPAADSPTVASPGGASVTARVVSSSSGQILQTVAMTISRVSTTRRSTIATTTSSATTTTTAIPTSVIKAAQCLADPAQSAKVSDCGVKLALQVNSLPEDCRSKVNQWVESNKGAAEVYKTLLTTSKATTATRFALRQATGAVASTMATTTTSSTTATVVALPVVPACACKAFDAFAVCISQFCPDAGTIARQALNANGSGQCPAASGATANGWGLEVCVAAAAVALGAVAWA